MKAVLIDDEAETIEGLAVTLQLRWPDITLLCSNEGSKGLSMVKEESPDIVILDINLPITSGFEVLRQMRLFSTVPVVVLTGRKDEIDELRALELGADDYITKPYSPTNLLARVWAVLRRSSPLISEEKMLQPLTLGNIVINFSAHQVLVDGNPVHLTATEYRVLQCLARNDGKVVTQEAMKQDVWGSDAEYLDDTALKRYIYQLRLKLGDNSENPRLIFNEHGIGYRLVRLQSP